MKIAPIRLAIAAALAALALSTSAQQKSAWDEAIAQGKRDFLLGEYSDADRWFKKALKEAESGARDEHKVGVTLVNLAAVKKAQNSEKEVEGNLKRAVAAFEKAHGPEHADVATAVEALGQLYFDQWLAGQGVNRNETRNGYTAFNATALRGGGSDASGLGGRGAGAQISDQLARSYQDDARNNPQVVKFRAAEESFQRVIAIREKLLRGDKPALVPSLRNLGELYLATDHPTEAEAILRRALAIRQMGDPENAGAAEILAMLASALRNQKKYAEAEPLFQRALQIQEQKLGADHPDLIVTLQAYAILLERTGRKADAKKLETRAKDIRKKYPEHTSD
jgi:tetratricopeptide (TPR) repeat protein